MTDYEIRKLSAAIIDGLVNEDRFIRRILKYMPKQDKLMNASQAAELLGVSRSTVIRNAERLGGQKNSANGRWMFHQSNLIEKYTNTQLS